jgi:hypothetical protein
VAFVGNLTHLQWLPAYLIAFGTIVLNLVAIAKHTLESHARRIVVVVVAGSEQDQ